MLVLDTIFPDGIHIPDYFLGKNIVHLPTMKCHIYTTTTGAMKNAFGGLLNTHRHYTHRWIHETLVDLLAIQKEIHPGIFAMMDGTTAGNGPGPRTMYPVVKNVMLASADQVAIDAVAAKMMGFDPMSIEYIRLAHEDGLGVGDPREIEIVGDVDAAQRELGVPRRQESRPHRRRRPDLVRPAEALPEALLPHAARERVHPGQRRLPRLLPLAAHRSPRVRALVRDDAVGSAVPALRPDGTARRARRPQRARGHAGVAFRQNSLEPASVSWQILGAHERPNPPERASFEKGVRMTLRRIAVPALVAWLVDGLYGYLVFGLMLDSEFAPYRPAVFRSTEAFNSMMPMFMASALVGFIAIAYIFAKGHEGGPGLKEGFWFGVVLGSLMVFMVALPSYVLYNIGQRVSLLISLATFVEMLIVGVVLGLVYKPAPAAARRAAV